MMKFSVRITGRDELDGCPAAVNYIPGEGEAQVVLNRDVFPTLPRAEKYFILAHELGHRLLDTSDETLADAFALGLTAGRQHRSLKTAMRAVGRMERIPYERLESLYGICQAIDKVKH